MSFNTLGLSAELLRAVADQGYRDPTPVQRQAIPVILEGRDVMARAQTGTGKTAGFTLPLLQRLSARSKDPRRRHVRALILTPTRELAAQVEESVRTYGRYLTLRSVVIFGGVNINPQIEKLRRGVEILVATPGRLLDHARQRTVDLSRVEILVLDEADRMLDMGFIPDIRKILALLPRDRQNLLFSATFSDEIRKLASTLLVSPARIEVARPHTAAEGVSQMAHPVDRERKRALLSFLIDSQSWRQVLVFTRTKLGANRLSQYLERDGIRAAAIHGNKSQGARTRALADFKRGAVRVLVATDIAARGLDIDQLPQVVNFELPHAPEDYLHRIGRTARAGKEGTAVSLVCVDEGQLLKAIERLLQQDIRKVVIPGYEPDPSLKAEPLLKRQPTLQRARVGWRGNRSHRVTGRLGRLARGASQVARPANSRGFRSRLPRAKDEGLCPHNSQDQRADSPDQTKERHLNTAIPPLAEPNPSTSSAGRQSQK
jgi:ATP-dependent RNA helicase RhlE